MPRWQRRSWPPPAPVEEAYRQVVGALVGMLGCLNEQVTALEQQLSAQFAAHPDAAILRSQPGLGVVLGARVLGEFGDAHIATPLPRGRKAFAGAAPVTRSTELRTVVVPGRRAISGWWTPATCGHSPPCPPRRRRGAAMTPTAPVAPRALGNRLVGILHGCLARQVAYEEQLAWPTAEAAA